MRDLIDFKIIYNEDCSVPFVKESNDIEILRESSAVKEVINDLEELSQEDTENFTIFTLT